MTSFSSVCVLFQLAAGVGELQVGCGCEAGAMTTNVALLVWGRMTTRVSIAPGPKGSNLSLTSPHCQATVKPLCIGVLDLGRTDLSLVPIRV